MEEKCSSSLSSGSEENPEESHSKKSYSAIYQQQMSNYRLYQKTYAGDKFFKNFRHRRSEVTVSEKDVQSNNIWKYV